MKLEQEEARARELARLEKRLARTMARTCVAYDVLGPGDRILVAVSGGKDSYGLAHLLARAARRTPFPLELVAVHVSQGQPGHDPSPLVGWLERSGLPFEVVHQDTFSVVQRHLEPGATACSICSRMRRGVLYTTARRLGCNKVALGHHREDTLATLLMNLFHGGKIQAMPARYRTNDGDLEVIRPLIEVPEAELRKLSELARFPIVPCQLCSAQQDHQRLAMNRLLDDLERAHPRIKRVMLGALKNVRPSHLLDPDLRKDAPLDEEC